MQRSAVVLAPINNDVIDNDVAPSRRRRRMDSSLDVEGIEGIEVIEVIEGIEGIEGIEISKVS